MKVAYKRVSSSTQSTQRQDMGAVDKEFVEQVSGKNIADRPKLQELIEFVREGDEVLVWSIDRLARDLRDLQTIVQRINAKGASVVFTKEQLTFSGADDAFSKLHLHLLGAVAEFERSIIKSRQAEGIAKAKERGVYQGRKKQIDDNKILELTAAGHSQNEVAELMGITRMSVYRCLKANRTALTSQTAC